MFDNLVIAERRVLFYVENMGFVVHYCVLVVSSRREFSFFIAAVQS